MRKAIIFIFAILFSASALAQIVLKQSTASQKVPVRLFDSTDHITAKTSITTPTITVDKAGAGLGAVNDGTWAESAGGLYWITLNATDTGTLGSLVVRVVKAACDDAFVLCGVVANVESDSYAKVSGLTFTNAGKVDVALYNILGTALTETSTGYLAAGFKKQYDVATPVFTSASVNQGADSNVLLADGTNGLAAIKSAVSAIPTTPLLAANYTAPPAAATIAGAVLDEAIGVHTGLITTLVRSTTPSNTLDVSSTGEAGLDFNNIKDAATPHTLTNITVPSVTLTGTVTTYTGNIPQTGDAAAYLTTNLGLLGANLTALGDTRIANLNATISSRSTLTAANVWDALLTGITTTGSVGKLIKDDLDTNIGSRMATFTYTAPPSASDIWSSGTRTLSAFAFTPVPSNASDTTAIKGKTDQLVFTVANQVDANALTGGGSSSLTAADVWTYGTRTITSGGITASEVENVVWNAALSSHTTTGSAGKALSTASTGGVDPDAIAASILAYAVGTPAAGTMGAAIKNGATIGTGSKNVVPRAITVSGSPVGGVTVWATTEAIGTGVHEAEGETNAFGLLTYGLWIDPGTHYLHSRKAGLVTAHTQIVVAADGSVTYP